LIWRIAGGFDDEQLVSLDFCEVLSLHCWIEQAAEEARMFEPLAGI